MSTPEKVALMTQAKALGYRVSLFFVTTEDPEINVRRVRRPRGGRRARRRAGCNSSSVCATMDLLPAAFEHADQATVLDNSEEPGNLRIVATKADEEVEFPVEDAVLPWVAEELTDPYMRRLASRKLLSAALADGRPVRVAEAAHGKDYTGQVIRVTEHHVLQDVSGELLLHDRQLAATTTYAAGKEQTVSYRYEHGKIVPVDAATSAVSRPQAPK